MSLLSPQYSGMPHQPAPQVQEFCVQDAPRSPKAPPRDLANAFSSTLLQTALQKRHSATWVTKQIDWEAWHDGRSQEALIIHPQPHLSASLLILLLLIMIRHPALMATDADSTATTDTKITAAIADRRKCHEAPGTPHATYDERKATSLHRVGHARVLFVLPRDCTRALRAYTKEKETLSKLVVPTQRHCATERNTACVSGRHSKEHCRRCGDCHRNKPAAVTGRRRCSSSSSC